MKPDTKPEQTGGVFSKVLLKLPIYRLSSSKLVVPCTYWDGAPPMISTSCSLSGNRFQS